MKNPKKYSQKKKRNQAIAFGILKILSASVVLFLFIILGFIVIKGFKAISWDFLTSMPEDQGKKGGIFPAILGTLYLVFGSMVVAFPVGILSGIYLNEYAKDSFLKKFMKLMTNNLSGVPSIVFGLFGMSLFVVTMGFGESIVAGSLTLGLLALPIVIRTTEEALKSVDDSFRTGSYALGASKLYTIRKVILPIAFPNIITGLILSIGRVSGETAPILFTAVVTFTSKLPKSILEPVLALPTHLYYLATSGTNIQQSRSVAYGTALVLIIIVLLVNLLANALRRYFGNKVKMN